MSCLCNGDFEKRVLDIRKEEYDVVARMLRRSRAWRRITKQIIVFSVALEVVAAAYAIASTRSTDLDWKMRAFRVLLMLLFPALSSSLLLSVCELSQSCSFERDEKTLERFHAERQAIVDERMEEINHYKTQQLIDIRMEQMYWNLLSFRTEPGEEIDLHEDFSTEAEIDLHEDFNTEAEIDLHEDFNTEAERQLVQLKKHDTKFCSLNRYHLVVRPLPCYDDLKHSNSLSVFIRDMVGLE